MKKPLILPKPTNDVQSKIRLFAKSAIDTAQKNLSEFQNKETVQEQVSKKLNEEVDRLNKILEEKTKNGIFKISEPLTVNPGSIVDVLVMSQLKEVYKTLNAQIMEDIKTQAVSIELSVPVAGITETTKFQGIGFQPPN